MNKLLSIIGIIIGAFAVGAGIKLVFLIYSMPYSYFWYDYGDAFAFSASGSYLIFAMAQKLIKKRGHFG